MKIGVRKLNKYLSEKEKRPSHFAKIIGVHASTIHRILEGANCPDLATAILIELHTNGAVKAGDWLVDERFSSVSVHATSGKINRK
jgi:plasmid maintenance system antidote protein VapI